jgi:hypothetical protein
MSIKRTLLVTTSLLDSVDWFLDCPASWRDKAYKSIVATIRREPYTPMPHAQRGIDFENAVYAMKNGSEVFNKIVAYCKGGNTQSKIKTTMEIGQHTVLLFGKIDVDFKDKIVDIKTLENAARVNKYLDKWQHIVYLYITNKPLFEYLVVLFEKFPSNKIINYQVLTYNNPGQELLASKLSSGIENLFDFLRDENLFYDYETTFSKNKR